MYLTCFFAVRMPMIFSTTGPSASATSWKNKQKVRRSFSLLDGWHRRPAAAAETVSLTTSDTQVLNLYHALLDELSSFHLSMGSYLCIYSVSDKKNVER